jgi:hypothetical protein
VTITQSHHRKGRWTEEVAVRAWNVSRPELVKELRALVALLNLSQMINNLFIKYRGVMGDKKYDD